MSENEWISGPLWREVDLWFGKETAANTGSRALAAYGRIESVLLDASRNVLFLSSLSPSQYTSLRIIREWWDCSIEEEEWFATTTDKLKVLQLLSFGPAIDHIPPVLLETVLHIGPVMPKVSTYCLEIYRLFQMEFDPEEAQETDDSNFLRFLQK